MVKTNNNNSMKCHTDIFCCFERTLSNRRIKYLQITDYGTHLIHYHLWQVPSRESSVNRHFVAFVHLNGKLYEMGMCGEHLLSSFIFCADN